MSITTDLDAWWAEHQDYQESNSAKGKFQDIMSTIDQMLDVMGHDKKALDATPRFVILDGIGKVLSYKGEYCTPLDEPLLREALGWMISEFAQ